ncbi:MAG: helix-turn-helix domain-containing protein [Armatimonadetes bacterium]|nr:helix-turn-helix domain-containing protein [Armatimonadota bacterium]
MASAIVNQYKPDFVSPPGDTLQETLECIGMTQAELCDRTGRPRKTISEIINGKAAITPDTALQFEMVLGIPASFWISRETHYREAIARQEEHAILENKITWLSTIPHMAMAQKGWIRKHNDCTEQLQEVLRYFGVASPEAWEEVWMSPLQVAYRRSETFESDPGAIAAWLRKGELEARAVDCQPYNQAIFLKALQDIRALTVEPPSVFQPRMRQLCANAGVAVVFVPELPRTYVCGATKWLTSTKALVQLSLRYKKNDHLWFTFFHEAMHILKHGKKDIFIESNLKSKEAKEAEADALSAEFMIPQSKYDTFARSRSITRQKIKNFARATNIAPGIVVGRLQHERVIPYSQFNDLKISYQWADKN